MFEANPTIRRIGNDDIVTTPLTYNGVVHRTGILLLLTCLSFGFAWHGLNTGQFPQEAGIVGALVGLVLAMIVIFTGSTNPFLIGAYALAEGVFLGVVSYYVNQRYPGIALQAVVGTMTCFGSVLALYSFKVIRATPLFTKVIMGALIGICALYFVGFIAGLFGHSLEFLYGNSNLSIGISVVIVIVASLSFVIDFAAIDEAIQKGADARFGWRFAFSLLVGLVWLYMEILRLLMKLRSRD